MSIDILHGTFSEIFEGECCVSERANFVGELVLYLKWIRQLTVIGVALQNVNRYVLSEWILTDYTGYSTKKASLLTL